MNVAIIDIGKTNAKVARVDSATATEIDVVTLSSPVATGEPYPHFDVEALWEFIIASLARFAEQSVIEALGVTTHGAAVALLDADGELALPVLDYDHAGPDACSDRYAALRPPFADSGSPRSPGGLNVGAQLYWQSLEFPAAFARVAHIVTWPQYWVWRLCGELASDLTSLGAHTDLIEPSSHAFTTLARAEGWDRLIPPLRRSGDRLACITPDVARQTGLGVDVPVHVGIHDSNASLVPHLMSRTAPFAVVSTGTWVIVMAVGGDDVALDESRGTLVNIDARGQPLPSARFLGGREFAQLSRTSAQVETEADADALSRVLTKGAMLLPSCITDCGPFPGQQAEWTVAEVTLDDAEHAIVVAHYLALMTATCLDLIGARGPIAVEGPFAKNRHLLAMLIAATARSVEISDSATGTSVGTAMLIEPPQRWPSGNPVRIDAGQRQNLRKHADAWMRLVKERQSG